MTKKRFISFFLLCAFTMLFAHSVIPHYHYQSVDIGHHDDQHNDFHDNPHDLKNDFFGHIFSHQQHAYSNIVSNGPASQSILISKLTIEKQAIFYTQYIISLLFQPAAIHKPRSHTAGILPCYASCRLLRGPPMA